MNEPPISKFPTEIFCHPYNSTSEEFKEAFHEQYCSYLGNSCQKPRKSEPDIKVGVCSIGYKGSFVKGFLPVIICPHRFREQIVFDSIRNIYLNHWDNIEWVSEVNLGVGGSVDYVAITKNRQGKISDFLCVEFQAGGTTGTPWPAVQDLKRTGRFSRSSYNYGINWANEFMKTMMQQVYKKGKIISHWKRKIIFVVQDVAISYLQSAVDTSDLHPAIDSDPIHFCTYRLNWLEDRWLLEFDSAISTDLEGINRILGGADSSQYPDESTFISNILRKGTRDGVFKSNSDPSLFV